MVTTVPSSVTEDVVNAVALEYLGILLVTPPVIPPVMPDVPEVLPAPASEPL